MIPFSNISKEKIAIIYHEQFINYGKLQQMSRSYQKKIQKEEERIVFIPMDECPETVYKLIACILAKKIFVPISNQRPEEQVNKLIGEFSSSILWTKEICHFQTNNKPILFPEDTLFIGFTSGTTGERKGFIRNQKSWINSLNIFHSVPVFAKKNYVTCLTPLHYSLGLYTLLQTLCSGQTYLLGIRKISSLASNPAVLNDSQIFSVPTVFNYWIEKMEKPMFGTFDVILGGESVTENQRKTFASKCPEARLFDFYGTSETSFISYNDQQLPERNCLGNFFPKVQVTILDADDSIGEIAVKSPMNFQGYLNNGQIILAEETIKTGDLGKYEKVLFYFGRKDKRINRKGEKIFPAYLEKIVLQLPQIKDALIYGVSDPELGERVLAEVVWKDEPLALSAINEFIKANSYRKGKIDTLLSVQEIQYNESGKKKIYTGEIKWNESI
ncbi:AMP-binding protein [Enterococcus thailandicus]|uniref:AMP-binding protein n=1 Tax=Enterococcus thailandicus TaxID=417368 RepID=UPI002891E4D9|nr:AMP-binding protein [Enterococcus thailandicus]MDT2793931.1 AMP-binding protein [Enterococcus thailandicus]